MASAVRPEFFRIFERVAVGRRCFNVRFFAGSLPFDSCDPVFASERVRVCITIIVMNLTS